MNRSFLTLGVLGFGVLLALGISSCGGSGSGDTPIVVTDAPATLTLDQFIATADGYCSDANATVSAYAANGEGITKAGEIATLRQGVIDAIKDLGKPQGGTGSTTSGGATGDTNPFDKSGSTAKSSSSSSSSSNGSTADLDKFLTAMAAEVAAGQKIGLASQRGEDTASAEDDLNAAKADAAKAASAFGFTICGTDSTSSGTSATAPSSSAPPSSAPPPAAPPSGTPAPPSGGNGGGGGVGI